MAGCPADPVPEAEVDDFDDASVLVSVAASADLGPFLAAFSFCSFRTAFISCK